jgi:hypothetical protein
MTGTWGRLTVTNHCRVWTARIDLRASTDELLCGSTTSVVTLVMLRLTNTKSPVTDTPNQSRIKECRRCTHRDASAIPKRCICHPPRGKFARVPMVVFRFGPGGSFTPAPFDGNCVLEVEYPIKSVTPHRSGNHVACCGHGLAHERLSQLTTVASASPPPCSDIPTGPNKRCK